MFSGAAQRRFWALLIYQHSGGVHSFAQTAILAPSYEVATEVLDL
jgi:hypothetical protein